MQLDRLEIERQRYGDFKGQIVGKITVSDGSGSITMQVNPDMAARLVDLCADALVDHAHTAAEKMTADLVENHGAIARAIASK